jgi:hypothetical protein
MATKENNRVKKADDSDGRTDTATNGETGGDGVPSEVSVSGASDPEPELGRELGLDQVFEILKNQRRRYVLQYLRERREPVSLSDLSEQIAAWENSKDVRTITSSERKRVYVGLYQCHLPKMDGMDVVDFNKPRAIIEPGENIEMFYSYLDTPDTTPDGQFSKYYLGLSVVMLVSLVLAALIESTMAFPAIGLVAGVAVLAFATTAWVHHTSETDSSPAQALLSAEE